MSDDLIRKLTSLENITDRYDDVIGNDAQELHRDCGVYESGFLHRELAGLEEEFRLLHIQNFRFPDACDCSPLSLLRYNSRRPDRSPSSRRG